MFEDLVCAILRITIYFKVVKIFIYGATDHHLILSKTHIFGSTSTGLVLYTHSRSIVALAPGHHYFKETCPIDMCSV